MEAKKKYIKVGNQLPQKRPLVSVLRKLFPSCCLILLCTIWWVGDLYFYFQPTTIVSPNSETVMLFNLGKLLTISHSDRNLMLFWGAKIWAHFVQCENFARLIAWSSLWRAAARKIHLNSLLSQEPGPHSATASSLCSKVHLPSYCPRWWACSERITGPYKWPILISILQAGKPEQEN